MKRDNFLKFLCLLNFILLNEFKMFAQLDTLFWFAAPEVSISFSNFDRPIFLRISTIDVSAKVVIDIPADPSFNPIIQEVPSGETKTIDLTTWIDKIEIKPANSILNNGLRIRSNNPVTVYYEVVSATCNCNPEIFALKGQNALGIDFFIPTQHFLDNANYDPLPFNSFDIVSTEDDNLITIVPTQNVVGHSSGIPFNIKLNKGQTYSVMASSQEASKHLFGSRVSSTKPIAITIKDDLLNGAPFGGCADLGGDQNIPMSIIGKEYIAVRGFLNAPHDKVFLLATQDNTSIYANGSLVTNLNKGQSFCYSMGNFDATYFNASAPIYVLQMSGFGCEVGLSVLPPIICTGSRKISFARSNSESLFLMILVRSGSEGNFQMNGSSQLFNVNDFNFVPGTSNKWKYARLTIPNTVINAGQVGIVSNSSDFFHLGIIHGSAGGGCRFGYFSDFGLLKYQIDIKKTSMCEGDSLDLSSNILFNASYNWVGPNNFTNIGQKGLIKSVKESNSGWYKISGNLPNTCKILSDSVRITIFKNDSIVQNVNFTKCSSELPFLFHNTKITTPGKKRIIVSNLEKCLDSIYYLDLTIKSFNAGANLTICKEDSIKLNASGGVSYTWDNNVLDGVYFKPDQSRRYVVTGDDGKGCKDTSSLFVKVNSLPSINAGIDTSVCFGSPAMLKAKGAVNYQWDNGVDDKKSFTPQETKIYKVIGTDANGCKNSDEVEVKVNPNPDYELIVTDPCEKQTLAFTVNLSNQTSSVGVKSSIWTGGSNFNSSELNPQISNVGLNQKGIYNLTLTDNNNCQTQKSVTANVSPEDQIDFADLGAKCLNDIIFTLPEPNIKGGSWSTNDNTSIQDEKQGLFNPSKSQPNSEKKVEVTYTTSSVLPTRKCPSQKTKTIIINSLPSIDGGKDTIVCFGTIAILKANGGISYQWDNGVEDKKSFITQATKVYKVIGTDVNGCKNSDEVEVKVNPNPEFELSVNDPCEKQTLAFSVNLGVQTTSVGVKSSIWSGGTNFTSNELNPQIPNVALSQKGSYSLTLTDNNNCQIQKSIIANVSPEDQIDFADLGSKCVNDLIFSLPIVNIKGGSWYSNDNTSIQDEKNGLFDPSKSKPNSDKKVEVTYTSSTIVPARKCPSQKTKIIIINPIPDSMFYSLEQVICEQDAISFKVLNPNMYAKYFWEFGDGTKKEGLNPIYTYTRDGLFTVKLTSFLGDCKVQQVKNEYIKVIPKPKDIDFIPNVIEIDFYNPDVEFNTYTKGKYYEWSFGDETGSTEQNPKHKYSMVPGSYLVTLRVSNMENHCDQSVAKVLLMPEPLVYFIPNTFSPNGDEINNVFQPIFTYGYDPERYSFYVYNRWGLLVFESHNTTIGWDGTFGNELASNDTYVWKLEFKEKSVDRMHSVQGTVNLLR